MTSHVRIMSAMNSFMTAKEVAERLGTTEGVLAKWRTEKRGPAYYKFGRAVRYQRSEVEQWIDAQKVATR